jgi:glycosyltransferase involved in cell wall biosynthesis
VIPQAFAARVPVVGFANAGFRELIDDGRTGFLLDCRTPEALAEKIREVIARSHLDEIAEAAWLEWRARFSLEAYRNRMIGILEQMT